ncbi:MAG TPA: DUF3556 domain-containing protein [Solirubrobacteraceae bacterium]|jgi:hypothetical protein
MGFIAPAPPPVEIEEWKRLPHLERIKPLAQDWAINGFGTPHAVFLLYIVKLVVYTLGGLLVISATTKGLGGLGNLSSWWTEPIVFEKAVVWTMLWEVLGLGAGSMPLTLRFSPMIGGVLYWLRPGTTRLPPWPERVPFTRGTTRTPLDVALYAGLLASAVYLLLADTSAAAGVAAGHLDPTAVGVLLAFGILLGLRDKVPFLAARAEVYGNLMILFLFPLHNLIVAAQIVFVCIWWGAAASKLNRHFPFVVTVMISNTPWNRSRSAKRRLWREHPEDLLPSSTGALAAHAGTVMEFTLPLLLLVSPSGPLLTIAVVGMIIFHVHIFSTFPLAVPLEWNVFMIFGILFLFGHYGSVPFSTLDDPLLIAILAVTCVGIPVLGNFRPDLISFLPSMRYYAGNWATSQWLFHKDSAAEEKLDRSVVKAAPVAVEQLVKFYDRDTAELLMYKGLAFRSMHAHGRALNGLLSHAVDDVEQYHVREGEVVAGVVLGYNFGDGHFHNEQLLEAVQERCNFAEGELRVIMIESQPAHVQRQHYRIYDAASGLIEEGSIRVADMVERQPWLGETGVFPVEIIAPREPRPVDTPVPR